MKKLITMLLFGVVLCGVCIGGVTNVLWTTPNRIPVLCVAPNGGLLAFCEQRSSALDSGYINAVLRRSMDNGTNWTTTQIVGGDGSNTYSCGSVVIDHTNNVVFLFVGRSLSNDTELEINIQTSVDTKRPYLYKSVDSGTNWTGPIDLTSSIKKAGWRFYDPGPGNGFQLTNGRLVCPFYYTADYGAGVYYYASVAWSDDYGTTWTSSAGATNVLRTNYGENGIVILTNNFWMMLARDDDTNLTGVSFSSSLGTNWTTFTNTALNNPGCEVSFVRYTQPPAYGKTRLLYSNPDSTIRSNGMVKLSYDEGKTWSVNKIYFASLFGYSALTPLPNGDWAILAENGTSTYYDKLTFISDTLSNLTGGADALDPQTNSQPTLSVTSSGTNFVLSWPASATNYSLQQEINFNNSHWTNATGTGSIVVTNGRNLLRISPTSSSGFFRLIN